VDAPGLWAPEACRYLRRSREWLRLHADEIGYASRNGRKWFLLRDLDAYLAGDYRPPKAEADRRARPRPVLIGQPGRINRFTGQPVGAPPTPANGSGPRREARSR
jgi:hypothetical protein